MDDYQLSSGPRDSICRQCGERQSTSTRLEEIATEQASTIEALRQELHDRDERSNAIMAHYEQLVRLEKGLARDAEEAERKAEAEIVVLTEALERLQALLTDKDIAF